MSVALRIAITTTALAGAAVAAACADTEDLIARATEQVRVIATEAELSSFAKRLILEYETASAVPPSIAHGDARTFINDNFHSRGRPDASVDRWGHPYRLLRSSPGRFTFVSLGPNGVPDSGCAGLVGGNLAGILGGPSLASDAGVNQPAPRADDDICVRVRVSDDRTL